MKVANVYRPDVATCPLNATLGAAARAMVRTDAGLVAVVDDGRLVGVLSERDLVRAFAGHVDPRAVVGPYLARDVVTTTLDADVVDVAWRMVEAGVRRLPVLDDRGEVVGVVSMRDLFALDTLMTGVSDLGAHA